MCINKENWPTTKRVRFHFVFKDRAARKDFLQFTNCKEENIIPVRTGMLKLMHVLEGVSFWLFIRCFILTGPTQKVLGIELVPPVKIYYCLKPLQNRIRKKLFYVKNMFFCVLQTIEAIRICVDMCKAIGKCNNLLTNFMREKKTLEIK